MKEIITLFDPLFHVTWQMGKKACFTSCIKNSRAQQPAGCWARSDKVLLRMVILKDVTL